MAEGFAALGHDVTLVVRKGTGAGRLQAYAIEQEVEIVRLSWPAVPLIGHAVYCALACAYVWRHHTRRPIDVLYGRDPYALWLASRLLRDVPVVFEAHRVPHNRLRRWVERALLARHRKVRLVAISDALATYYRASFSDLLDADRVTVAHSGGCDVGPPAAQPVTREALPASGRLQLGYVGSDQPGKGVAFVARLADALPQFDFHIVGAVRPDSVVSRPANLFVHGQVAHRDVPGYLARFQCGLAPFSPDGGGLGPYQSPLKLFEYMAHGLAIVCTDNSSIREVLTDGETALLLPQLDVDEWSAAILRLADEPGLRERLGAAAAEVFSDRYTWTQRARHVLA